MRTFAILYLAGAAVALAWLWWEMLRAPLVEDEPQPVTPRFPAKPLAVGGVLQRRPLEFAVVPRDFPALKVIRGRLVVEPHHRGYHAYGVSDAAIANGIADLWRPTQETA